MVSGRRLPEADAGEALRHQRLAVRRQGEAGIAHAGTERQRTEARNRAWRQWFAVAVVCGAKLGGNKERQETGGEAASVRLRHGESLSVGSCLSCEASDSNRD